MVGKSTSDAAERTFAGGADVGDSVGGFATDEEDEVATGATDSALAACAAPMGKPPHATKQSPKKLSDLSGILPFTHIAFFGT
jgi:hypothetical protein